MEHPRTKTIDIPSSPVFLNREMICRLKTRTFTYVDIDLGHYLLAVQWTGKKFNAQKAEVTELDTEAGLLYYFELVEEWSGGLTVKLPPALQVDLWVKPKAKFQGRSRSSVGYSPLYAPLVPDTSHNA